MPVRPVDRMDPADLQDLELVAPFAFTKGCRVMRLPGKVRVNPYGFGHLLFDTLTDPRQERPLDDVDIEAHMVDLLYRLLRDSDAPQDQYARLGLEPSPSTPAANRQG